MITKPRSRYLLAILCILGIAYLFWSLYLCPVFQNQMSHSLSTRIGQAYASKSVTELTSPDISKNSEPEDSAQNAVTSVIVHYRGFDTLGELTVLITSVLAALLILPRRRSKVFLPSESIIIRTITPLVLLTSVLVGLYFAIYGHLSPGGGFPAGALVASGAGLVYLTDGLSLIKTSWLSALESLTGLLIIVIGLLGLALNGSFLSNILPHQPLGTFFSGGFIMPIYLLISIKVAAELTGLIIGFRGDRDDH